MLKDKIKQLFSKTETGSNKRKIENLAVFLVILVVTLIIVNLIWGGDTKQKNKPANDLLQQLI